MSARNASSERVDRGFLSESLSLISSFVILAGSTYLFWVMSARTSTLDVTGTAMVLVSLSGLVAIISKLGLDVTSIRFLCVQANKRAFITRTLLVSNAVTVISGVVVYALLLMIVGDVGPAANVLEVFLVFLAICVSLNTYNIIRSVLVAVGKSRIVALGGFVMGLGRVLLLFPFMFLGLIGILAAFFLGMMVAILFSLTAIGDTTARGDTVVRDSARSHIDMYRSYSLNNYFAQIAEAIPALVLPTIILALSSSMNSAFYYTAFMIFSILTAIVNSVGNIMLAEGPRKGTDLCVLVRKGLVHALALLLPFLTAILVLRGPLLSFFGEDYAESSSSVLLLMGFSSIPFVANTIYAALKRLTCEIWPLVFLYALSSATTISVSVILFPYIGIVSTGLAWLVGQLIVAPISILGLIRFIGRPGHVAIVCQ